MNLDPRLLKLARSNILGLALTVFFGLTAGLLAIGQARLLSGVIAGAFLDGKGLEELSGSLIWLLGVMFLRASAGYIGDWNAAGLAGRIKNDLRERMYAHLVRIGPVGTARKPAGELAANLLQGADGLETYFSQFLPQVFLAGLIPLGVLFFVFPLDALSGIILLVTGPLIPLFMFLIGSNAEKLTSRQFKAMRAMSAELLDTLQGLKTLKALGRSQEHVGRVAEVSAAYREITLQVLRVTFLSALALELLGTISTAIIAVQVGLRLLYGQMVFEQAFFLLVIAPDFYLPLRTLGLRFHASMQGISAVRQIFELLGAPALTPAEPRVGKMAPQDWAEIVFEDVSFRYPDREEAALDGLHLRIRRGGLTALVGPSGAGKSTAAGIMLRNLSPQKGSVWVGGRNLSEISGAVWREETVWVGQRPHLFRGSIADNLRVAEKWAGEEMLWEALELARLDEFVHGLPERLNSPVGEGGAKLSSGQAQRLALARAFLRRGTILVLDEPTAHLDPVEENLLAKGLSNLCRGKTVLAIAHRLETIYRADQIVVMAGGKAVETGKHEDLAGMGGEYTRLLAAYWSRR